MKKSQLVQIIRDAVRTELLSTLPSVLKEYLKRPTAPVTQTSDIVELASKQIVKSRKLKQEKSYSRNPAINKILNETVGGVPVDGPRVGGSDSDKLTNFDGQPVAVTDLPDHLSKALTRNYSDVLNLVDKKRGGV
jgi:hypothetical protein